MDPLDIQFAIKKAGFNQTQLADELNVSGTMISRIISGETRSRRVQEFIAEKINKKISDIWPNQTQKRRVRS